MKNMSNNVDRIKNFKTFKLYNKINRKSISKYRITHTEVKKAKNASKKMRFSMMSASTYFPGKLPSKYFRHA